MDKKTILVVMPVYNAEKTLNDAIKSILRQRYKNFHLVIVDDASTDDSVNIAKKFLSDPRVTIYVNKKNKGAYYCRNYGIYAFRRKTWGYFTTHDADDISYEPRYLNLIKLLGKNINAVQDVFVRKDLKTRETINTELTMAHALFPKQVLKDLGYFDDTRFGGDWEHWERLKQFNKINKFKTAHDNQPNGESYIHDKNLTVLIPLKSKKRQNYVTKKRQEIAEMISTGNLFRDFEPSDTTKEVKFSGIKSGNPKDIAPRIAVIVLTWKRPLAVKDVLTDLSNQTFKDFTVYVSNGNLKNSNNVDKYSSFFREQKGMSVKVRHDGNDLLSFRRLIVAQELAKAGTDIIFYIDDDIRVPKDYIERCLDQYQEKTYNSGYAWTLFENGKSYYTHRERRWDNKYRFHYCGTGVSMIDAKIFLEPGLTDLKAVPEGAYKIEDLWLSYYADHVMGWELKYIDMPGVTIGGVDEVALYKRILKEEYTKDHFLRDLVEMGWKIPKKPIKA